jgi:hypothetical protein
MDLGAGRRLGPRRLLGPPGGARRRKPLPQGSPASANDTGSNRLREGSPQWLEEHV